MFLAAYILLGILEFFLVTFAGSHMLEARLEKSITSDMYQTAHRIAESDLVSHFCQHGIYPQQSVSGS